MGSRERREIASCIEQILLHLLKLRLSPASDFPPNRVVAGAALPVSPDDLIAAAGPAARTPMCPIPASPSAPRSAAPAAGVFAGCNVENAAYPQSQCAEATAIGAMVAAGEREIVEVAVVAGGDGLCSPAAAAASGWPSSGARRRPSILARRTGSAPRRRWGSCCPWRSGRQSRRGRAAGARMPLRSSARAPASAPLRRPRARLRPRRHRRPHRRSGRDRLCATCRAFRARACRAMPAGWCSARIAGVPVACLQGRAHLYEGVGAAPLNTLVRTLKAIGCRALLLTNASGSLRPDRAPGTTGAGRGPHQSAGHQPAARRQ